MIENLMDNAVNGDSEAQFELGVKLLKGDNISKDIRTGVYWIKKSANLEFPNAILFLGMLYFEGLIIEKDLEKGYFWLQKSANQNNAIAQYRILKLNEK